MVRDYWQPSSCSPALSFSLAICQVSFPSLPLPHFLSLSLSTLCSRANKDVHFAATPEKYFSGKTHHTQSWDTCKASTILFIFFEIYIVCYLYRHLSVNKRQLTHYKIVGETFLSLYCLCPAIQTTLHPSLISLPWYAHLKNAVKVCPLLLGSEAILCPVAFCQLKRVPTVWAAGWRLLAPQPLPGRTVTSDPTQMGPQANTRAHGWIPLQSEWQSGHGGRPTGHRRSWGWAALTGPKC